uniref:VWFD domain-containing protein n=1 Tax=Mesocestoides corti TaxID=53468 RepID=A0A5K3EPF6_MESCO
AGRGYKRTNSQHPWGRLLPLANVDSYVFDGKTEFEKQMVFNLTKPVSEDSFVLNSLWNFRFKIKVNDSIRNPNFEDWSHMTSDNAMILMSADGSPLSDLKTILQKEIATFCRHPLPNRYYLSMQPYPDRQSRATLKKCSAQKHGHWNCLFGENLEAKLFQRTLNDPCSISVPTPLEEEPNSFYCTSNSPLVTEVFDERLTDTYADQKDERCDKARRICQLCLTRSCGVKQVEWNMRIVGSALMRPNSSRCQIPCYASSHCLQYFSRQCYPLDRYKEGDRLCFRGKTLKFTLTPDFDFKKGNSQCHIRRQGKASVHKFDLDVAIDFSLPDTNREMQKYKHRGNSQSKSHRINFSFNLPSGRNYALFGETLRVKHIADLLDLDEAILVKTAPQNSSEYESFFLDSVKESEHKPKRKKITLFRQREQKYITFQNIKPLRYNTENWNNQGCYVQVNDGIITEHSLENISHKTPVAVSILQPHRQGEPFAYIINKK